MTQNPGKLRFRNMSDADKLAIINAPKREFYSVTGWSDAGCHAVLFESIYRLPVTQDTTYWPDLHKRWRWQARDRDGAVRLFEVKPSQGQIMWLFGYDGVKTTIRIDHLYADFTPGTCDWRDSLQERPEDDV